MEKDARIAALQALSNNQPFDLASHLSGIQNIDPVLLEHLMKLTGNRSTLGGNPSIVNGAPGFDFKIPFNP